MAVTLAKVHERFAHGQNVIVYPSWTDDLDELADWGEEMIIEEVIDSETIVVRPFNSDGTFSVPARLLSSPFGDPCRCRD